MEDIEYVVKNSHYIKLNLDKIDHFIEDLGTPNYIHWSKEFNLDLTEKEWILLAFIVESMNFCFWQKPKWIIEYQNEKISGSNALLYTIIKQVEKDKDFLNITNLNKLTFEDFKIIFKGISGECPFLKERYQNFKETINYISNHDFYNELYTIKNNQDLLKYITNNFNSFKDISTYKGKKIYFYKRATLLTNDIYHLSPTIKNNVHDVNNLRGCADYGIPRTFRDYGILIYNDELSNMVDNEIEIKHNSEMEIEIRANILYIIELIKEKLKKQNTIINSVELDSVIWNMGKKMIGRSNSHHTITIYY